MVGMVSLRFGKPIEWDSDALKVKGESEAEPDVNRRACLPRSRRAVQY